MEQRIENIYNKSLAQHQEFSALDKNELLKAIELGLNEINKMEYLSEKENIESSLTKDIAHKIAVLWDFSGPGVYSGPDRDDRYKDIPWTRNMERDRLNYTFAIFKKITKLLESKMNIFLRKNKPIILYNGTIDENNKLRNVIKTGEVDIPKEKFIIIDNENIHSTNDQIKTIIWPKELHKHGKEIGLISHAPHLWRIVHVLNQYDNLPKDMKIRLFPIKTPENKTKEYAEMEIMGLLYYSYVAKEKSASTKAYPYIIHGEK